MTLADFLNETISRRSFSSMWFWIVLGLQWWLAGRAVLGIPFDMVLYARREPGAGEATDELEALARISVNRQLRRMHRAGPWIVAGLSALVVGLGVSGFWYGGELAQALFCLVLPQVLVAGLDLRAAHRIADGAHHGIALQDCLIRLRLAVQILGFVSVLAVFAWGMYRNLTAGLLG